PPAPEVLADPDRPWYFLDGQLSDLQPQLAASIPTVNGDWQQSFRWDGTGKIPTPEAARLKQLSQQALKNGQKVRFWNLPASTAAQRRAVWRELLHYPGLLVGADELRELKQVIDCATASLAMPCLCCSGCCWPAGTWHMANASRRTPCLVLSSPTRTATANASPPKLG
ncbi:hypothetical protein, partial [Hymenobacter sp. AT01-02]|uniref:hypothetical protein n=1 Tax=Hymenobacter sp. AT01-02 TaxID=1571877 RepID=UPI00191BE696